MIAAGAGAAQQQQHQRTSYDQQHNRGSFDMDDQQSGAGGYDRRSSEEYDNRYSNSNTTSGSSSSNNHQHYSRESAQARVDGIMGGSGHPQAAGYSVASTHDYLGYPKDEQPFSSGQDGGLWDDNEKAEELW